MILDLAHENKRVFFGLPPLDGAAHQAVEVATPSLAQQAGTLVQELPTPGVPLVQGLSRPVSKGVVDGREHYGSSAAEYRYEPLMGIAQLLQVLGTESVGPTWDLPLEPSDWWADRS